LNKKRQNQAKKLPGLGDVERGDTHNSKAKTFGASTKMAKQSAIRKGSGERLKDHPCT